VRIFLVGHSTHETLDAGGEQSAERLALPIVPS
jgi:hypothetical protein